VVPVPPHFEIMSKKFPKVNIFILSDASSPFHPKLKGETYRRYYDICISTAPCCRRPLVELLLMKAYARADARTYTHHILKYGNSPLSLFIDEHVRARYARAQPPTAFNDSPSSVIWIVSYSCPPIVPVNPLLAFLIIYLVRSFTLNNRTR
jgi:hypothetical protein